MQAQTHNDTEHETTTIERAKRTQTYKRALIKNETTTNVKMESNLPIIIQSRAAVIQTCVVVVVVVVVVVIVVVAGIFQVKKN